MANVTMNIPGSRPVNKDPGELKAGRNAGKAEKNLPEGLGEKSSGLKAEKEDKVEIRRRQEEPVTYTKEAGRKELSSDEIRGLQRAAEQAHENLRRLVERLILKQTEKADKKDNGGEDQGISKDPTVAEVQSASIFDDPEFGVEAVSDRLVDFAIRVSGGDTSKLELLKEAIHKGFEAAREQLGGELPEISQRTYEATMRKMDEWASQGE